MSEPPKESCETCRFWLPEKEAPIGACRRYPPTNVPIRLILPPPTDLPRLELLGRAASMVQPQVEQFAGWQSKSIPTNPGQWCGEWSAKPTVAPLPPGA
jgi:hypothetical protein